MTNKQLEAILDMTPARRFEEWRRLRQQWVNGYDTMDLRLAQRIDDDHAELLARAESLSRLVVEARQEGFVQGVRQCVETASSWEQVEVDHDGGNRIVRGCGDLPDRLLALIGEGQYAKPSPAPLPDFRPIDAGGYR